MEIGVFKWPWNRELNKPYRSAFTLLFDDFAPWRVQRPYIELPKSFYKDLNNVFRRTGLHAAKYSICPLADGINWIEDESYSDYIDILREAQQIGVALGLEGLTHYYVYDFANKRLTSLLEVDLFNKGSEDEIYSYLRQGMSLLEKRGLKISGFTSPFWCGDQINAYKAFDRLGWTWSFNVRGVDYGNDPVVRYGRTVNIPSYEKTPDYFGGGGAPPPSRVRLDLAKMAVRSSVTNGEMCALYTHFQAVFFSNSLDKIRELIDFVKGLDNVWIANPDEIARFWLVKEDLRRTLTPVWDESKNKLYISCRTPKATSENIAIWVVPPHGMRIGEVRAYYGKEERYIQDVYDFKDYIVVVVDTFEYTPLEIVVSF